MFAITTIGVISDTHGLLRPEALRVFNGVGLILHAGDIGRPEVIEDLRTLAPVVAVRGNNDEGPWARRIPEVKTVRIDDVSIYMLHELKAIGALRKVHAVISGHSHRPVIEQRDGILFLNPGSAGPRRFRLPVTVARLIIQGSTVRAEIVELQLT